MNTKMMKAIERPVARLRCGEMYNTHLLHEPIRSAGAAVLCTGYYKPYYR